MNNLEEVAFGIITEAAQSKYLALESIKAAEAGNYNEADAKIKEAETHIGEASKKHFDLIAKEASGEKVELSLLLMHAEDQLLSIQTFILMAEKLNELHRKVNND